MEEHRVIIASSAKQDIRGIYRYISTELGAPATAMNMVDDIEKAIDGLSFMPKSHPRVHDDFYASMGYRMLSVKKYIVFYSIDENEKIVNVERILHARRDWEQILKGDQWTTT